MKTSGNGRSHRGEKDILGANSEIARKLRQHYDEIAADAVPERFAALLSQLEQAETAQSDAPRDRD